MSNSLVINPPLPTLNYTSHFPFRAPHKSNRWLSSPWFSGISKPIRSSSLRGTNISSSPKSASLIPYYPIPVPYSRIPSSKNLTNFYSKLSKMPSVFLGAKMPSVLLVDAKCSPWRSAAGLFRKSTAGRVAKYSKSEPQLNGLEGGFEPDLNYFFPTQCDRVPWSLERKSNRALPLPFREGGGGVRLISKRSFLLCATGRA